MNKEIEEAIEAMTPAELRELEGELDKRASDSEHARLFAIGQKLAKDAFAEYEKTGEISPVLELVQAAASGTLGKDSSVEVMAELDKMSEDELVALERELDKEAEEKLSAEYAAGYFEIGRKLARDYVSELGKEGAGRVAPGLMNTIGNAFAASAKKNPIATMAGTALIGAPIVRAAGRMVSGDR